jgi:hypothetical protein
MEFFELKLFLFSLTTFPLPRFIKENRSDCARLGREGDALLRAPVTAVDQGVVGRAPKGGPDFDGGHHRLDPGPGRLLEIYLSEY